MDKLKIVDFVQLGVYIINNCLFLTDGYLVDSPLFNHIGDVTISLPEGGDAEKFYSDETVSMAHDEGRDMMLRYSEFTGVEYQYIGKILNVELMNGELCFSQSKEHWFHDSIQFDELLFIVKKLVPDEMVGFWIRQWSNLTYCHLVNGQTQSMDNNPLGKEINGYNL